MKQRLCFLIIAFLHCFYLVCSNADSEHLLAFKASSDFTNALSTWSNDSEICSGSWLGVTCNKNNQVTHLVLESLSLSGSIESLAHLTHLRLLSLKNNTLYSSASVDLSPLKNIKLLYLSRNQFAGDFITSSGIPMLRRLRRIDLSHNRLSGKIPITQLLELPHLLTLRLEGNSFSGSLDLGSIDGFKALSDFNVSGNELSGQIPESLSVFPSSCFDDNKNLCGKPLLSSCDDNTSDPMPIKIIPNQKGGKKFNRRTIAAILAVYVAGVATVIVGICLYCRRRRGGNWGGEKGRKVGEFNKGHGGGRKVDVGMVFFEGYKGFRVDDLLKSSAEMLGKGSVGTTYKVVMDSGDVVVVKRAKQRRKNREIERLLRVIGGLRHRNLMNLRAYYCSRDELLLVYDFIPKGSLHSLLHGNRGPWRTPLDWTTRLKLASGLAEGLAFLHNGCKTKLSHGHLTSSNVLVDEEGNACISDVALHQLFVPSTPSNSSFHEYPESQVSKHGGRKFSQKSDVYDFGLILLEVLTGKTISNEGGTSLIKWVQSVGRGELASEVFDFELLSYKEMEEEMVALLQVAFLCLKPSPHDRPKMNSVFKMIEDIRGRGSRDSSISQSTSDLSSSPSLSEEANALH